ncbi:glycerol-3-phosphate cytidylyltransferase [Grimontia hollisae]|uniref:Glycerol-3-phosphate cytidylyltransferase n=1 Tax=Grimontia hollisae TaxID=673 RepID=A0A377HL20_GRIHO|nr:glycerol-3-phosphate cytidylyltransferase [Grimontia hollisae]MDF2184112.1 glycerol-3-phosphate cytidylyltransferase [Grimontia hollisae]STO56889.1 Glycerol-3-phosphate cytidylyltransferase [Grimontia hollisae]STQ74746.1 Glycerol-3-phosphate cytidylyltransferase [Grimontia hollisae]
MKTVITYGTFDLFHVGHIRLLKRLKCLGDRLVVGVSSDEFNESKGKKSFFSYKERAEIVAACRYVDEVFPEHCWEQKLTDITTYNADIFAMGCDWEGKFDKLKKYCEVIYLPRTDDISSTEIKQKISMYDNEKILELEKSVHDLADVFRCIKS